MVSALALKEQRTLEAHVVDLEPRILGGRRKLELALAQVGTELIGKTGLGVLGKLHREAGSVTGELDVGVEHIGGAGIRGEHLLDLARTYWLMGSLSSAKTRDLQFALIPALIGMVPLFLLRWRINLLTLGEEEARSLGVHTTRLRLVIVVCATLITSACVSVSGMIGWVGLVIPHFARMLFGDDYKRLIPASMLLGGAFLMVVDNIARLATSGEIPLGILTSVVGAPVFVWLILRGGADREH